MPEHGRHRRRTVLKTVGTAGVATLTGLAGCTGGGDGGDGGEGSGDGGGSDGSGGGGDGSDGGGDGGSTTTTGDQLEDSVTVYANTEVQEVMDDFTEATGVEVDLQVLTGPRAQARFLSEAEAGTYRMDVLLNSAMQTAWNHDHWAEVEIDNSSKVLTDLTESTLQEIGAIGKVWPYYQILGGFVSNPNAVSSPPDSWEGLPEMDARMGTAPFNTDNVYRVVSREMDGVDEYYPRLHEAFAKFPSNHTVVTEQVIGGQLDVGVHVFLGSSLPGDAPIDVSFPPWTSTNVEAAALSNKAPHPNAGEALVQWLASEEGQLSVQAYEGGLPAYPEIDHGNDKIKAALDEYDPTVYQDIHTQEVHQQSEARVEELTGGGG